MLSILRQRTVVTIMLSKLFQSLNLPVKMLECVPLCVVMQSRLILDNVVISIILGHNEIMWSMVYSPETKLLNFASYMYFPNFLPSPLSSPYK